jgi:hypothetical protein
VKFEKLNSKTATVVLAAAVFAAGFLPHLINLNDPFLRDDWVHLLASQHFSFDELKALLWPSKTELLYRPVSAVYFWANYRIFGLDPADQRIIKLAAYALCGAALFYFLISATGSRLFALVSSLVFAIHPLNESAAVWLSTHANCLSVFFGLLALIFFVKARQHVNARAALYAAFLLSMLLSWGSMEMLYGLPVMVLATDLLLLRPRARQKSNIRGMLRWHLPYLCVALAFYAFRFHAGLPRYLARHTERRPLADILHNAATRIPKLFVTPDGTSPDAVTVAVPLAIGLLLAALLAATIIIRRKHALYLTLFSLIWYVAAAVPNFNFIPWTIPSLMGEMRHLFAMNIGLSMLIGTATLCLAAGSLRRIILLLILVPLVGALGVAQISAGKEWTRVARTSQSLVDCVGATCQGSAYPLRIVFLDYPLLGFEQIINIPVDSLTAAVVTNRIKYEGRFLFTTAYTEFDTTKFHGNELDELLRFYPLQLSGLYEKNAEPMFDQPEISIIHKDDLQKTFFFYWDAVQGECRNCTDEMRERLGRDRKAEPIEWRGRTLLGDMVRPRLCGASRNNGLLYLAPDPVSRYPNYVEVLLPDNVDCGEYDQVVLRASFASKTREEGTCGIRIAWMLDNETESAALLNRFEEMRAFFHTNHAMNTIHIPLAQWLAREKGRRIIKLYIIIPRNITEIAIESISLTKFWVE